MKNWNKLKLIEKHRSKRDQHKRSVERRKITREEKFNQVLQKQQELQKDFEKYRKQKLRKFNQKEKEIEDQKSQIQNDLEKKKKVNLFKHLDQKDNFNRERTFYKRFTDRVLSKHQEISLTVERKKEKERQLQEAMKKEEEEILKDGTFLVTNYLDAYYEQQKRKAKSRKTKERIKSLTGTGGFELLKILPKIKDEKKEDA